MLHVLHKDSRESSEYTVPCGMASGVTRAHLCAIHVRLDSRSSLVRDRASWMRNISVHLASKSRQGAAVHGPDGSPQTPRSAAMNMKWEIVLTLSKRCVRHLMLLRNDVGLQVLVVTSFAIFASRWRGDTGKRSRG